jgi:hypothetical protein
MYPHIGINGSIGLAANSFAKLFNTNSWTGSIGPSMTWNILLYGRLLANVRFQDDLYQQLVANYQNTLLTANQDAENALVAYLQSLEQARDLKASATAATDASDYLIKLLRKEFLPAGADTSAFLNQLFTTLNFMVTQQDQAAQAEGNIALNLILLYRALGGGWQIRLQDGVHGQPAACNPEATTINGQREHVPPGLAPPAPATDQAPAPRPVPLPGARLNGPRDVSVIDSEPPVGTALGAPALLRGSE